MSKRGSVALNWFFAAVFYFCMAIMVLAGIAVLGILAAFIYVMVGML